MKNSKIDEENALFPAGMLLDFSCADAEEMRELSSFWSYEHKQFGKGKFEGRLVAAHTQNVQLSFTHRTPGIFVRGGIPSSTAILSLPCFFEHSIYYYGQALKKFEGVALRYDEELELQTSLPSSLITIAVDVELLEKLCLLVTGYSFDQLRVHGRLTMEPTSYGWMIDRLLELLGMMQDSACNRAIQKTEDIEGEILRTILSGVKVPRKVMRVPDRIFLAGKAEGFIRRHLKNEVSIKEIARNMGMSERTLHLGFKERFGVSPKSYMRMMRLNGVRRDLFQETPAASISNAAMRWGFFHFSRFAEQYNEMFGELPSKTKKNIRDGK